MNELPHLVNTKIFNYLPLSDLINYRIVCKKWKILIDNLKPRNELVLFHRLQPIPLNWQHSNERINLTNSIVVNDKVKHSEYLISNYKKITDLFIAIHEDTFFKNDDLTKFLQNFENLINLEIYFSTDSFGYLNPLIICLNLKNLRTFFSAETNNINALFECPLIKKATYYDNDQINSRFPTKVFENGIIEFLKVNSFLYETGLKLPNLEVLYFNERIQINFSEFPKLKMIHFYNSKCSNNFIMDDSSYQNKRVEILRNLIEQKELLKRDNLDIFYEGIKCKDARSAMHSVFNTICKYGSLFYYENYEYYKNNQDDFNFNHINKLVKYSDLFNVEISEMDIHSMEKFSKCIFTIYFGKKVRDEIEFKNWQFIFKNVKKIILKQLPQKELDKLPDYLPNILDFICPDCKKSRVINFEFLSRFKGLKCFFIQKNLISLDEFKLVLNNCKFFFFAIFNPSTHFKFINGQFYLRTTRYKERFFFATKNDFFDFLEEKKIIVKL